MAFAALVVAIAALLIALLASSRAGVISRTLDENGADSRRTINNLQRELEQATTVQRELLARLAEGETITREMVMEGVLFRDIDEAEAKRLIEDGHVTLIDVRTPSETAAGFIPGARLLPMDQIESHMDEIPRHGIKLIYCAAGSRSAGVCDALAARGYQGLLNLEGGIAAWTGNLEKPA